MTREEQQAVLAKGYSEAMRYIANAKETLQKAGIDGYRYKDKKYVRTACGTAYNGVLVALDTWLEIKDVFPPKGKRKSIEFYTKNIGSLDKKILDILDDAYTILHIYGYYEGNLNSNVIKAGFKSALEIINKIKPVKGAA